MKGPSHRPNIALYIASYNAKLQILSLSIYLFIFKRVLLWQKNPNDYLSSCLLLPPNSLNLFLFGIFAVFDSGKRKKKKTSFSFPTNLCIYLYMGSLWCSFEERDEEAQERRGLGFRAGNADVEGCLWCYSGSRRRNHFHRLHLHGGNALVQSTAWCCPCSRSLHRRMLQSQQCWRFYFYFYIPCRLCHLGLFVFFFFEWF